MSTFEGYIDCKIVATERWGQLTERESLILLHGYSCGTMAMQDTLMESMCLTCVATAMQRALVAKRELQGVVEEVPS